jgi:hypothetical protein
MLYLLIIGPLSYIGIALILFFIISFFIKKENILAKTQRLEYQNIKLEITLNILVFIAGLLLLYFDYNNNYRDLRKRYDAEKKAIKDTLASVMKEKDYIKANLTKIEKVNYEFEVRLQPIDTSEIFPEASDLECYYKETSVTDEKKALIDKPNGGAPGVFKILIYNVSQIADIPVLRIKDRKGNEWGWTRDEQIKINPPQIDVELKIKK